MHETTTQQDDCPDTEQIRSFALGNLPADRLTVVGAHLENCQLCCSVLESYDDDTDTFVDRLRVHVCETIIENDAQLKELIGSAERLWCEPGESAAEPATSLRLEQYELLEVLGQGGMGIVYRAWHKKLQRHVAIKFLPPHRSHHPQSIERFHREMAAVGRLHHPNIVHAYDAGEVDGRPYLVMELVDGSDTRRLVEHYGPLPVAAACEIVRQTAEGLQHAHHAGLLHRDIKPSNVMLTEEGRVKILDLGLARFDATEATAHGSRDHDIVGTGKFVAPEQVLGSHSCDSRADLYSLGSTFYFLLTGRPPIEPAGARTLSASALLHAEVPHTPISKLRTDVSPSVAAVLNRCLEKQPDDRFQSAAALEVALAPLTRDTDLNQFVSTGKTQVKSNDRRGHGAAERIASRRRLSIAGVAILLALAGVWLAWFSISDRNHVSTTAVTANPGVERAETESSALAKVELVQKQRPEDAFIEAARKGVPAGRKELPPKEPDPPLFGKAAQPPLLGTAITTDDTAVKNDGGHAPQTPFPKPENLRAALADAPYQIDGVDAVNLKIAAIPSVDRGVKNFGPMVWSPDGQWFYLLDENNVVYKVDGKSLEQVARLDTGAACSGMSLSSEGLVVGLSGLQALWILDADTLAVKRQIPVDTVRMIAASPTSSVGYAASAEGLYVVDLRGGRPLFFVDKMRLPGASSTVEVTWSGAFISMCASEDGQYLFTANGKGLNRLRIAGDHLIWEQSTGDIYQGYQYDLCLSKDGKWVTVPTDAGNRLVGSAVAVFDSKDLQRPALVIQRRGHLLTAVAFDPKTGNIYAAEKNRLDVFGPRGGWLKRLDWPHGTPHHISVHPGGELIAVWSREKLVVLDFKPGRLATDLTGTRP